MEVIQVPEVQKHWYARMEIAKYCNLNAIEFKSMKAIHFTTSHGEVAVGVMILACWPGGVTSNILTKLAKGDTALSISYTAVVSVATVVTLPLIVGISMDHFMGEAAPEIDILGLGITMFLLTTVPVLIGMSVRHFSPSRADSMEKGVNLAAAILFVIIVLAAIASEWDTLMDNIGTLGPAVIVLNVIMLTIGYKSAVLLDLEAVRATWGPVTGLVHGAGVLADKKIGDKSDEDFNKVFATKVLGLQVLLQ